VVKSRVQQLPVLRLVDKLRARASDALQFGAEECIVRRGFPMGFRRPEDPDPFVGGSRSVNMKVTVTCVKSDDARETLLPPTEEVMLHETELFLYLPTEDLLNAPITDPLEMFFESVEVHQD